MRAGPLSSPKVIDLLNHHFVPAFVSIEDYAQDGQAAAEEKARLRTIMREAGQAGLSTGTVHVYLLAPDGKVIDTRHVADATRGDTLADLLAATVSRLKVPRGEPLIPPAPQSQPPAHGEHDLVLHLVARYAHECGSWNEFPSEDWVVFHQGEIERLLPRTGEVNESWDVDPQVAAKLLLHFYPQTENNDVRTNRIDAQSLRGTVVSMEQGTARARIDGKLRMKHSFYPRRVDNQFVEATLLGYIDFEPKTRHIRALRLVTDLATYGKQAFLVAVESVFSRDDHP
jgi:hypothetical protein